MGGKGSGRRATGELESQGRTRIHNLLEKAIDNVKDELEKKQLHPQVSGSSWRVIEQCLGKPTQSHELGLQEETTQNALLLAQQLLEARPKGGQDAIQGSGEGQGVQQGENEEG